MPGSADLRSSLRRPLLPLALAVATACGSTSGSGGEPPEDAPSEPGREAAATPTGQEASSRARPLGPLPRRGTAWVIFGRDTVVAEVARTPDQRARGLMYRDEVPDGTGMLFVWDEVAVRSFWMENTYVPLDVAFFDRDFRIIDIQRMQPETTDMHESPGPVMLALEVREGWFAEHGIAVGDEAEILFGG